jgi:hypothetical protein
MTALGRGDGMQFKQLLRTCSDLGNSFPNSPRPFDHRSSMNADTCVRKHLWAAGLAGTFPQAQRGGTGDRVSQATDRRPQRTRRQRTREVRASQPSGPTAAGRRGPPVLRSRRCSRDSTCMRTADRRRVDVAPLNEDEGSSAQPDASCLLPAPLVTTSSVHCGLSSTDVPS